jgi:hypothetical protein
MLVRGGAGSAAVVGSGGGMGSTGHDRLGWGAAIVGAHGLGGGPGAGAGQVYLVTLGWVVLHLG